MTQFSIIVPCFNAAKTIQQTMKGFSAQTFPEWEAICVDDGSSDDTVRLIKEAARADPRIRLVRNPGKGPSHARNFGAEISKGSLIAFCDADDIWTPTKLCDLNNAFKYPSVDAAFGKVAFFNENPADASTFSTVPLGDLTIQMLLGENPVCTMSNITIRREAFEKSSGFNASLVHNEDLEWLIRLVGGGGRVIGLPVLHTMYRTSVGGLSTNLEAMSSGRKRAMETAARYGVSPSRRCNAIHERYRARRALRLGQSRTLALRCVARGLLYSPFGFFSPLRRGGLTFIGAFGAIFLPRSLSQSLFS